MSRSDSSPPSPSPGRRPLNIRLILGALAVVAGLLVIVLANRSGEGPPEPAAPEAGRAEAPVQVSVEAVVDAALIKTWLDESRSALKRGDLRQCADFQARAENEARAAAQKWPEDREIQELARQAAEIVFQFEADGGADPPRPGQAAKSADRYPDEADRPGAGQINDLFLNAWASEKRRQPEAAIGIYHQALDRLDDLLRPGEAPAPAVAPRHSEVPIPPSGTDRTAETAYLQKYYAVASRLAELETGAGREDRAEAVRRRALAALDQALARGAEAADLNEILDPLLSQLARRERFSGRLESARLTQERRLGLKQYLLSRPKAGPASAAAGSAHPDVGLGSAQLPPTVAAPETGGPAPAEPDQLSARIRLELAWLGRHTFHFDEGLDYLAELPGLAGSAVASETDRLAWLAQGEMLMDLGRFQEAELALQKARPYLSRLSDGPRPAQVGRVDVEPRVTAIRANLALAELALAQADLAGADRYMEEAVSLYRTLPGGHPVTFDVQLIRVQVLARKGDSQRAERELSGFLADSSQLLASAEVDIWVKRQILALMAEAAWQARARGETNLAVDHYKRVNDELTPYITGIDVANSSEYGSLFRPILVEIMEGEGDLRADLRQWSQAESRYVLGLDMARALRDQEPRQYFWRTRFESLAGKVERFHY